MQLQLRWQWLVRRRLRVWNLNPADWSQGRRDARRGGVGVCVRCGLWYRREGGGGSQESKASERFELLLENWRVAEGRKRASCSQSLVEMYQPSGDGVMG